MATYADTTFTASGADPETHDITWPFQDRADVLVYRNGVLLVKDTDYRFSGASQLQWSSAFSLNTAGDTIRVLRSTSRSSRLTTYTAVRLNKDILEADSLQAFYMAQEALDATEAEGSLLESTDAGAGYGPQATLYRNSVSPADSDGLGEFLFDANDSGGNRTTVAALRTTWIDVTDGTEDAEVAIRTVAAGTLADRVAVRQGFFGVGATGGDQGADTVNMSAYYIDGTDILSSVVLQKTYVSSLQTITSGGLLTLVHGLGAEAKVVELVLQCTAVDAGYSVGNRIIIQQASPFLTVGRGMVILTTATQVQIRYSSDANAFAYPAKITGVLTALDNTKWQMEVRAYA